MCVYTFYWCKLNLAIYIYTHTHFIYIKPPNVPLDNVDSLRPHIIPHPLPTPKAISGSAIAQIELHAVSESTNP